MTGEPEGLGLYGMVTPFGGDYIKQKYQRLTVEVMPSVIQKIINSISHQTFPKELCLYLKHDNTDLLDTLNNGLRGPCNGDGTLC